MSKYTNEELVDLIRSSTGKDRDEYLIMLYEQNTGIIYKIGAPYAEVSREDKERLMEDLLQEGFIALQIAVDHYDPDKGSFVGYASIWIRQMIRRYLDNCGSVLRLPVYLREKIFQYIAVLRDYQREHGQEPTNDELMEILSVDRKKLQQIENYSVLLRTASLDKVIGVDGDAFTLGDMVADPNDQYQNLDDQMDDEIVKRTLWKEVDSLGDQHAEIIRLRYQDQKTLQTVGDELGITRERVRKIESEALRRLKRSEKIKRYAEEYVSAKAYRDTGLTAFRLSGTSATERTAINLYDRDIKQKRRQMMSQLKKIEKKYHIELGEEYIRMKMDEIGSEEKC